MNHKQQLNQKNADYGTDEYYRKTYGKTLFLAG